MQIVVLIPGFLVLVLAVFLFGGGLVASDFVASVCWFLIDNQNAIAIGAIVLTIIVNICLMAVDGIPPMNLIALLPATLIDVVTLSGAGVALFTEFRAMIPDDGAETVWMILTAPILLIEIGLVLLISFGPIAVQWFGDYLMTHSLSRNLGGVILTVVGLGVKCIICIIGCSLAMLWADNYDSSYEEVVASTPIGQVCEYVSNLISLLPFN